ncbi:MAG: tetratricopeptide repeat protein [Acidobacteria bacterium]|nr:tetratricopeptide repeat protein [Acidobacteriota bacterium]
MLLRLVCVLVFLALGAAGQQPPADDEYKRGYLLFVEGKLEQAEAIFRSLYEKDPPDIRGLLGLTEVYAKRDEYGRAKELLDAEIRKQPGLAQLKVAWANLAMRSGKPNEAIAVYEKLLDEDPKNFDLCVRIAEAYRQTQNGDQALKYWGRASEIRPNEVMPILSRAMMLDAAGRAEAAVSLYEQTLLLDAENVVALNNLAYYLADREKDLDRAMSYAQKAAVKAPKDLMIADTLGFVYLKQGMAKQAADVYRRIWGATNLAAMVYVHAATAYLETGDRAEAKRFLELARRNRPSAADSAEIQKLAVRLE